MNIHRHSYCTFKFRLLVLLEYKHLTADSRKEFNGGAFIYNTGVIGVLLHCLVLEGNGHLNREFSVAMI